VDRSPYQLPFNTEDVPNWRCPICKVGRLTVDKKSFISQETAASSAAHDYDGWEPEWVRSVFSCVFQCDNKKCGEPVSCCGSGRVETTDTHDEEYGWIQIYTEQFYPDYFFPPLNLMDIPKKCPESVINHLKGSFALFFADPGASLNGARAALEALLTDIGVKRYTTVKKKRRIIPLHHRITLIPPKYEDISDLLLAVKWLGNAGSHDGDNPSKADMHIAYDLLEHVLSEIYDEKGKNLAKVAKKVNKRKGPIK